MLTLDQIPPTIVLADVVTPPDSKLSASVLGTHSPQYHWFVAETKTRQEKTLARYLAERAEPNLLGYYLPYVITKTQSGNRVFNALLPGFVFVAVPTQLIVNDSIPGDDWIYPIEVAKDVCRDSRAVWGFIPILPSSQSRFRQDLIALSSPWATIEPSNVSGSRVVVIAGPLQGMTGTLISTNDEQLGQTRILFDMQVLSQPYSTLVPTEYVRPS